MTAYVVEDSPAHEDIYFLDHRLGEYNRPRSGAADSRFLCIFVRDEGGEILAGLHGWTWGGCLEVKYLWVREDLRRQGHGTALLQAAEAEARARGCRRAFVATHSFQAPGFYPKHGYRVVGQYDDYPEGHVQYFLRKELE